MLRKWLLGIAAAVIIFTMLILLLGNRATEDTLLAKNIMEQANGGSKIVSLNQLTTFDWEKAQVYGPYFKVPIKRMKFSVTTITQRYPICYICSSLIIPMITV
ncbi:hypothetical protein V2H29_03755 [Lysinibacillus fusiformis]|uniref:hypothetical protein n=1 Tax=Lysinibacillus fusiformis TaxID=28031 RepID=UPI002EA0545C|nr:hypothetical protein [Lysinibacillus fusiformis]